MPKIRKNEGKTDIKLFNFIRENKKYSKNWTVQKCDEYKEIQEILDKTSKKWTWKHWYPDLIYVNDIKKVLILIENKDLVKDHIWKTFDAVKYAIDWVKHYLSFFTEDKLSSEKDTIKKYLNWWKIIWIAFSWDIDDEYNHRLDTFIVEKNKIKDINKNELLDEDDYISFFENIDLEKISSDISKSSGEINRLLRNIDSQKRPILLSALMVCLFESEWIKNSFKSSYLNFDIEYIISNIPLTIQQILKHENISQEKIDVLLNELAFTKTDKDLNETNILVDILKELEDNVIPLFKRKTNYDIIGKFYEEFLRYAWITNVKKWIVLTPNHITTLFTDLIDIKINDVIFDPTCWTGAFLIAGMNKLIKEIEKSSISDKIQRIKNIKEKQLIWFEKSSTMYSLAVSNMLFRWDWKSQIFNEDFFSEKTDEILAKLPLQPTIWFINPPYWWKDNKTNPTKKEIQFLEKMLDNCSRYWMIIAPLSTYFKDDVDRNRILSKHTLKYVINMPGDLFQPNASTHTAIAVFETNLPHSNKEVAFYDLKDDWFALSKNKWRTDVFNKWNLIKKDLLNKIKKPKENEDLINLVYKNIYENDEWIIQAHSKTDYSKLSEKQFDYTIKEYIVFSLKSRLNLLDKDIDEITMLELLNENNIDASEVLKNNSI